MSLTFREAWGLIHGMLLGGIFLLAFTGGLAILYAMHQGWLTEKGLRHEVVLLRFSTTSMALISWLTVITGTYVVYPWYREKPPEGADLRFYPRSFLTTNPDLANWHTFGMEWKEHIGWFSPLLATVVAYIAWRYGRQLSTNNQLRRICMIVLTLSFLTAIVAALFGALITKAAPIF